jgi:hypothetical protein
MDARSISLSEHRDSGTPLAPAAPSGELDLPTRALLAAQLLEDREDPLSFEHLTMQRHGSTSLLQSDFLALLANALFTTEMHFTLSEFGVARMASLLEGAAVSQGATELAVNLLTASYEVSDHLDDKDRLTLAAISYLQRAANELTPAQTSRIVGRAFFYGVWNAPCGSYTNGTDITFDFQKQPEARFDLEGAGAILLLSRIQPDLVAAAVQGDYRDLCKVAIQFSERYPTSPNLFLLLMRLPIFESQRKLLHNYQHNILPEGELRNLVLSSIGRSFWLCLPSYSILSKILLGRAKLINGLLIAVGMVSCWAATSVVASSRAIFKTLQAHSLSPVHREHLDAVVASVK